MRPQQRRVLVSAIGLAGIMAACKPEPKLAKEDLRCVIDTLQRVVLRMDTTVTFDQPDMHNFAVNSRGEVFASPSLGGSLLHWGSDGTMFPLLGSTGEGPGQFAGGPITPFVVAGDTMYARDNHQHWVVFGPDHNFVRFGALGPISASFPVATQFLRDGLVLSAYQNGNEHSALLVVDRMGLVVKRIGPSRTLDGGASPLRAATSAVDGTYWVGPEITSRGGYSIQQWDSAGKVLREIRREVPWFIADSLLRPFGKNGRDDASAERPFLFPRVHQVVVDSSGLLWVVTYVPRGPEARTAIFAAKGALERYSISARVLEKHLEVIDPTKNTVLATAVFPSAFLLMPNAMDAVQVTEDSATGLRQATRLRLRVQEPAGGACR